MHATMRSRVEAVAREAPPAIAVVERADDEYRPNLAIDAIRPHRAKYPDARILVSDDEDVNLLFLGRLLAWGGYRSVTRVSNSSRVMSLFDEVGPDLVMLDLEMPSPNGFELLEEIGARTPACTYLPVIVISGRFTPEVKQRAFALGARDFITKPFDSVEVLLRVENLLRTRLLHLELSERRVWLEETVQERTRALRAAQVETLRRLAQAAEFRDDATGQHTRRVGALAGMIARRMGLPDGLVETIRQAAPLHDVGKIGVADRILLKPGGLTTEEFSDMKRHTVIGADLLAGGVSEVETMAEEIARFHHERWDGNGYPDGLAGDEIPLSARIVAVADFYDALSHERPYRPAWPRDAVIAEIERERGGHFDPRVTQAFLELVEANETDALEAEWAC